MDLLDAPLDVRWRATWDALGLAAPSADVFATLCARYAEPHRRYHTLQHLVECLDLLERHRALAARPGEVAVALWFHDAIYETRRHDNEAESAAWARRVLARCGADDAMRVRVDAAIMATRHGRETPATPDDRLLVDIDLAILGAAPSRFADYEAQIRAEYAWVDEAVFREKRREVLRSFLERPSIYETPALRDRFEAPARVNLALALGLPGRATVRREAEPREAGADQPRETGSDEPREGDD